MTTPTRIVTGVTKDERGVIIGLCGLGWTLTSQQVERAIEGRTMTFRVGEVGGAVVNVVYLHGGGWYLRSEIDGVANNNLDNLPLC